MTTIAASDTATRSETAAALGRRCRFCSTELQHTFVDLGMSPLCETYPTASELNHGEVYYPLHVFVCGKCFLVQLEQYDTPENIFGHYAYFSSYSDSWLNHSKKYCETMISRLGLHRNSFVIEVASNDGYLLQYFVEQNMPVLGIEPAANVAKVAIEKGIPTMIRFFGAALADQLALEGRQADLIVGNNVLAQVPDLNDFVEGLKIVLKPRGVITLEFPHLLRLIERNEFDTIYHEHFSYFSLATTIRILGAHGLRVFDVDELPSHGGSLRIYACRAEDETHLIEQNVQKVLRDEEHADLTSLDGYAHFASQVKRTKFALLTFLLCAAREGKRTVGYGAPGKSATLLHYCGIGRDLITYTVDRSPYKRGRFLPGTHIPIHDPDRIRETQPDYVIILPWNLKAEISTQLSYIRDWNGRFVVPIPQLEVF